MYIKSMVHSIDNIVEYLDLFLEHGELGLYPHFEYEYYINEELIELDKSNREDHIDNLIINCARELHIFNKNIIPYPKAEPESYTEYLLDELFVDSVKRMDTFFAKKNIERKIFQAELDSDIIWDQYLILKCAWYIIGNLKEITSGENKEFEKEINYKLSFSGHMEQYEDIETSDDSEESDTQANYNAFRWFGSPAELSTLMQTLADNGYIDTPYRKDGGRNNEGFSRKICSIFQLDKGSVKSVLNNLKDSRITPDNNFKLAMDKLPKIK